MVQIERINFANRNAGTSINMFSHIILNSRRSIRLNTSGDYSIPQPVTLDNKLNLHALGKFTCVCILSFCVMKR